MYRISVFFLICLIVSGAQAEEEYVTVKQDGTGDYETIQAALDDTTRDYDEIVVFPGRYEENIQIKGNVKLFAVEGPYLTCIDGHMQTPLADVITISPNLTSVEIIGFTVANGRYGVNIKTSSHVLITNCVAFQNTSHGFYSKWDWGTPVTQLMLYNSVSYKNGGSGYYMFAGADGNWRNFHHANIYNNIFASNSLHGLQYNSTAYNNYSDNVVIDCNNVWDHTENYGANIGPGKVLVPTNSESENPRFLNQVAGPGFDARLQDTSRCREKGRDGASWLNPDGTRNDMGAFGGPHARTFYESPTDGPIVREVRVSPGTVPRGEAITIEATVAVR